MNQPAPAVPPALPSRRNPIVAFFVGLWDVMNFTRRLIMNIVFFGLLLLFLAILLVVVGKGGIEPLQSRTTLVIAPEGRIVEQFTKDAAMRALAKATGDDSAEEVQLRDLLRAIKAAKEDKNVERVLLDVDKLQPSGYASLNEVARALADLRASGKQIVAFSEGMGQWQYLLAAQANEIYLDPMGSVVLEGMGRYRQYYRQALQDKLGVEDVRFGGGLVFADAEQVHVDA